MEGIKSIISFIGGVLLTALCVNLMGNVANVFDESFLGVFIGLGMLVGFTYLCYSAIDNMSKSVKEGRELANKNIQAKRQDNEMKMKIVKQEKLYQEVKSSFQFFSDEKLEELYKEIDSKSYVEIEKLAMAEELVKRGIITHSPIHEKLFLIKKKFGN